MDHKLYDKIAELKAINTHSHHLPDEFFIGFNLDRLMQKTYISWCGAQFDESQDSRREYLNKVRYKSYFVWLQQSLKELYDIKEELTADNWELYSSRIQKKHNDKGWHKSVLKKQCVYDKLILDAYWDPGSRNGDTELFASTFRIDPLFFGYSKDTLDHDGNNVYKLYDKTFNDLDTYMAFVRQMITEKIGSGCIALKNAIAYDRSVEYNETSKDQAAKVFKHQTEENIKHFQDYLFYEICELANELCVPVQCHAGLGCINKTNAIHMREVISKNPETIFVLFHGSFPWTDDILALLHAFPNVYADICWLPLLSPTLAVQTLHAMIEIGTADKICWGCDTWTSEESYGARLAVNSVLNSVLNQKIGSGYLSESDAVLIAKNILYNNAEALYNLYILHNF